MEKSKNKLYFVLTVLLAIVIAGVGLWLNSNPSIETPNPPIGLTGGMIASTELGFSWEAVEDATSYLMFRDEIEIAEVDIIAFLDQGLEPGTTYTYQIKARNSDGVLSTLSEPLTLTTAVSDTIPPAPSNLHTMKETDDSIDMMWGASFS